VYSGPAWSALALLKTGEHPLWFELSGEGPALIESPGQAALTPYHPWPHARFVAGMQNWEDLLVLAVNREGFLILAPAGEGEDEGVLLYRAADSPRWEPYSTESFFMYRGKPALLLYRDDFFTDPSAPALTPPVFTLDREGPLPRGVSVPALESALAALANDFGSAWEAEALRRGTDGRWYYRLREKGKAQGGTAYFRSGDLDREGEKIPVGAWRQAALPESAENAGPLVRRLLEEAPVLTAGGIPALRTIAPGVEAPRGFAAAAASGENLAVLYGCSRDGPAPLALGIRPDGRGLIVRAALGQGGEGPAISRFSLPPLPEGYVYTGLGLGGNVLAASWEEQQEAGIGAAGFMVMNAP
jgi:hypothetical protein